MLGLRVRGLVLNRAVMRNVCPIDSGGWGHNIDLRNGENFGPVWRGLPRASRREIIKIF